MEQKTTLTQAAKHQDEFMGMALTADAVVAQQTLVKEVIRKVMKKDVHFGVIPGCEKPTLYKAGAEVLNVTFRLSPDYITETIIDGKHMTARSKCILTHIPSGRVFGSGEALCTTREKKYRIRKDQGKIVENANLEDCWNTVLKIGNKRALIAAVLNVTACSDEFTQDMGDDVEPLVVVDTEVVVKAAAEVVKEAEAKHDEKKANAYQPDAPGPEKEEAKQTPAITKEKRKWSGKIVKAETLELPDHRMAWALEGVDGVIFKTDDPKLVEGGIESGKVYDVTYHLNTKGTCVIDKLKEAKE